MGVVYGFKGAGLFAKFSLLLLVISATCAWVAFTCTGWVEGNTHYGLWRACTSTPATATSAPIPLCTQLDGWPLDWWTATQAMVTFGFIGINIALCLTVLYMFFRSCFKNGEVGMATAVVCIVTGILYLIGVIVFAVKVKEDFIDIGDSRTFGVTGVTRPNYKLSYCFGLSIVALLAELMAGILMYLDSKKGFTSPLAI